MRRCIALTVTRPAALILLLALGAAFLLAACTSNSPAAPSGQPTPAPQSAPATQAPGSAKPSPAAPQAGPECPVLAKQEVEATLGTSVLNADVLITEGTLVSCSYRNPKSAASILAAVIVKSDPQAKLGYDTRKELATDPKAVAGLGDDAYREEAADNLEVMSGKNAITLSIGKGAAPDRLKAARDLAIKVITKLGTSAPASPAARATPAPGQVAALDGCALLTKAEVEAAIDKTVEPVKVTAAGSGMSGCAYQIPEHKPQTYVDLSVFDLTPSQAKGLHEATKGGDRDQVAAPGLGDDAYWDKTFFTLYVLKGKYAISLSVDPLETSDPAKVAQALAPKVLSRLP